VDTRRAELKPAVVVDVHGAAGDDRVLVVVGDDRAGEDQCHRRLLR
jgi:hypothetical protein